MVKGAHANGGISKSATTIGNSKSILNTALLQLKLLEACLELMASGAVIAVQDMGAAGLTCSAVEMGAKGDLGIDLDLDKVPCREAAMSAYEASCMP